MTLAGLAGAPALFMLAENCCVWDADRETCAGLTLKVHAVGVSEMVAAAVCVESAWLVAVSVMVWAVLTVGGAV